MSLATCRWLFSSSLAHAHFSCSSCRQCGEVVTSFPMGVVWVSASTSDSWHLFSDSRRFRTSDVLPGWLHTSPLCCRSLLRIWVILVYLNVALRCLPVIFTRVCCLCSQCHLEFESRSWAAIYYNPPDYSIGRHVFLSGILSVLSGGTVNLLILVTMNFISINSRF